MARRADSRPAFELPRRGAWRSVDGAISCRSSPLSSGTATTVSYSRRRGATPAVRVRRGPRVPDARFVRYGVRGRSNDNRPLRVFLIVGGSPARCRACPARRCSRRRCPPRRLLPPAVLPIVAGAYSCSWSWAGSSLRSRTGGRRSHWFTNPAYPAGTASHELTYGFGTATCGANTATARTGNRTSYTDVFNGGAAASTTYCYDNADRLTSYTETSRHDHAGV